jgi:hypothetical protein
MVNSELDFYRLRSISDSESDEDEYDDEIEDKYLEKKKLFGVICIFSSIISIIASVSYIICKLSRNKYVNCQEINM